MFSGDRVAARVQVARLRGRRRRRTAAGGVRSRYHKVAPAPRGLQFKLRPANANTLSRRPLSHRTAEAQHAIVFTCERVARPFSHAV